MVGGDVGQSDRLAVLAAEYDVDLLWSDPLDPFHLLGVVTELQDRRRLHMAGELGVLRLVAVIAERTRVPDLPEEVGVASPRHVGSLIEERRLEHDVDAGPHRVDGVGFAATKGREAVDFGFGDLDDAQPGIGQRGQVGGLVFESPSLEDLEIGIVTGRLVHATVQRLEIEHREMPAREVPRQIAGAHDQLPARSVHTDYAT